MKAFTALALALAGLSAAVQASPAAADGELIPRQHLFGNPTRTQAMLSPDGKYLAFLAPRDGVLNIWVAPNGRMAEARPVTEEKVRPIRSYFWAPDSSVLLYIQDQGGNEDYLLYGTDPAKGTTVKLTPFEKTRVQIVAMSPDVPHSILVGINNRDPRWHDVYRLDLKSGKLTLVRQNDGYAGFEADRKLNLRLATKSLADGGMQLERIATDGKTQPLLTIPAEDALSTRVVGIPAGGDMAYLLDTRQRDRSALMRLDLKTGVTRLLAESTKVDVQNLLADPRSGKVQAIGENYLHHRWLPLGKDLEADIAFLDKTLGGRWEVSSRTRDDRQWTLLVDRVAEPASVYLYDRPARKVTKLFSTRPELEGRRLAPMQPLELKSRDGKTLVSYLSLPPGSDKDGDGRPDQPLPLVLNVHGGPWARDDYGYRGDHQWLANRGYAVLSVNFRGSTGFGKAFLNAGDRQWGAAMHDDLIDAVDWAVRSGITQGDKVAIYGGSYGGYATLWGMTSTPDRFACGVDVVGPSNLNTLLASVPAYWASFFEQLARRVADPRTEEGRALLTERSPLTHVQQIRKPLLIAQGANDPRVKQAESDQIVQAMKARQIPVTYALYPDEGHGFARPANRISFYGVAEAFLSHCLGGSYQPLGDDLKGASLQVPEGVDYVPGLKEALGR